MVALPALAAPIGAVAQNDGGSGGDAGDTFESATLLRIPGRFHGFIDRHAGDRHDYYRFALAAGDAVVVTVATGNAVTEPITLLDPNGVVLDAGQSFFGLGAPEPSGVRLEVRHAIVAGEYRVHLSSEYAGDARFAYSLCFRPCAAAGRQDDAASGGDAGDALATATRVAPGTHWGSLVGDGADDDDYYRFRVEAGRSINIDVIARLWTGSLVADDNVHRLSFQLLDPNGLLLDTPNSNQADARVTLAAAPVGGDYFFRVTAEHAFTGAYGFCFNPPGCPAYGLRPIAFIEDGSIRHTVTRVLLVPPTHGDLGNPRGPTVIDYLDAALRGIRAWERVIDRFAADYPQFAYLRDVDIHVEAFDAARPVDPAGYDFVIEYVQTGGPFFRGFAGGSVDPQPTLNEHGLGPTVHASGRHAVISLFAASPRAGQVLPDYPEINDIEAVTMHEVAHVFGLGHTPTWTTSHGPDLMNSPAPFVYGDGDPLGDGGERTPRKCPSTLELYGLAVLYRWVPRGAWEPTWGNVALPWWMPYRWYC